MKKLFIAVLLVVVPGSFIALAIYGVLKLYFGRAKKRPDLKVVHNEAKAA